MRRTRLQLLAVAGAVLGLIGTGPGAVARPDAAQGRGHFRETFHEIAFGDDQWTYEQVPHGADQGFEAPRFDDSDFSYGTAGFGTNHKPGCASNNPIQVHTPWTPGTDLLLRRSYSYPGTPLVVDAIHVRGTVTDSADIYVNGELEESVRGTGCQRHDIDFYVSDYDADGGVDLLAVRATSAGSTAFFDLRMDVTADEDCDCRRVGPIPAPTDAPR